MKKKQLKQVQNQDQEGRSMVEMLGVLAIIGVLSLGGIAGYRMAMNRYQANQIAHEINLMRTDAKIKVARGVGELLLGEPYDGEEGHLKFNESYGVKVESKDIFDEETNTTEKGYSFTLSGIPAGVCKPLATLLDGMDDTAVLEINGGDYTTTENPCSEPENKVFVAFSTKDLGVSGGGKEEACDESTCEGYCSADGECKDCPADAPWNEATRQCKCSSSKHWNKEIEACAACGDNSHCTSSSKPACIEGVCSACTEDSQCDTEQNEHCSSSGSCITCGSSASAAAWNETTHKCDTCKNVDPENPNWNGSECVAECPTDKPIPYSNQCVECRTNSDCDKKGDGQHYWCDTDYSANYGTCKICTYGWDEEHGCKIGECESNADCREGEYCYLYWGCGCNREFGKSKGFGAGDGTYKSECRKAESDINKKGDTSSKYIMSTNSMTWWSAERFCKALNKQMVTISELQCNKNQIKYNYDSSAGECRTGYCHAEGSEMTCNKFSTSDVSSGVKALRKAEHGTEMGGNYYYWLYDAASTTSSSTSCNAYNVRLNDGHVDGDARNYSAFTHALCE